jgi:SEC-C motif
MSTKIGRNDPCVCGSGKKYKHCCGAAAPASTASSDASEGAVKRALAWLEQHHRKAWAVALEDAFHDAVDAIFDFDDDDDDDESAEDDAQVAEALQSLSDDTMQQIHINLTEWMLAEGEIQVKGEWTRVSELLLGPRGPLLEVNQRDWLEQLARQPLRLYDVTEVVPGSSVTLCDALSTELPPIVVDERTGSRSMRVGMQIGTRVMAEGGEHRLSGAMYPFSAWAGRALLAELRSLGVGSGTLDEDDKMLLSQMIIEDWLAQFLRPGPLPQIIDSSTGEPMLFTTDHYDVLDWDALAAALGAQPDVQSDRVAGWSRHVQDSDGMTRSRATIEPSADAKRVSVQYRTAGLAERGRPWFNALAGAATRFVLTEVSDPKGMLAKLPQGDAALPRGVPLPPGIDPVALADALASVIRRTYANWADEPIPALDGRTPRQAIASASGRERVKGLLRSYEDGESQVAAEQGRSQISYQFLWDALGLTR